MLDKGYSRACVFNVQPLFNCNSLSVKGFGLLRNFINIHGPGAPKGLMVMEQGEKEQEGWLEFSHSKNRYYQFQRLCVVVIGADVAGFLSVRSFLCAIGKCSPFLKLTLML